MAFVKLYPWQIACWHPTIKNAMIIMLKILNSILAEVSFLFSLTFNILCVYHMDCVGLVWRELNKKKEENRAWNYGSLQYVMRCMFTPLEYFTVNKFNGKTRINWWSHTHHIRHTHAHPTIDYILEKIIRFSIIELNISIFVMLSFTHTHTH